MIPETSEHPWAVLEDRGHKKGSPRDPCQGSGLQRGEINFSMSQPQISPVENRFILDRDHPLCFCSQASAAELSPNSQNGLLDLHCKQATWIRTPTSPFLSLHHVAGSWPPVGPQSVPFTSCVTSGSLSPITCKIDGITISTVSHSCEGGRGWRLCRCCVQYSCLASDLGGVFFFLFW